MKPLWNRGLGSLSLVISGAVIALTMTSARAQAQQRLPGYSPDAVHNATALGRLSATEPVQLTLSLPLRNEGELQNLIERIYDPRDPMYRQYLTPESFTARFGPTQADYDTVASYAVAHGLSIVGTPSNRLLLDVSGPAQSVENAFAVKLGRFKARDGHVFRAPDRNPTVPDYVASRLSGIVGLDTSAEIRPQFQRRSSSSTHLSPLQVGTGPNGALTPNDIRTAYDLKGSNLPNGSGQTLALFELDGYTASDITAYEDFFLLPHVPLRNVLIDGFSGSAGAGAGEVTLDIELMAALAPGASSILVYEGPNSLSGTLDTYNQIATDNLAKSISTSWGLPEDENYAFSAENSIFSEMAAQGQSIFAAAGDSGAYDDGASLSVDDPASQPYVVGVGGTRLSVGTGEVYASESTWNSALFGEGGGGGISLDWSIPSWQQGLVPPASLGSSTMRNVPDVSLDADPDTGYAIRFQNAWTIFGGTSCAAPLWAAFAALANQARATAGDGPLGFPNPLIYQIGSGPNYRLDFHDIADKSTNLYFPAVTGYDDATGWGTFDGAQLLADLAPGFLRPPATPSGIMVTTGNAQLKLNWTASAGAASYNVQRSTTNGGPYTSIATPTTNTYTDSGLTNGTTYYYVISAVNGSGVSANSGQVSGVPVAASATSAVFLRTDTTTQGNWKGVYGADGYNIFEDSVSGPPYAQTTPSASKRDYVWNNSPTDARALLRGSTGRIAACWYNPSSYSIDLNLTDGNTHRVAFYFLDWEPEGRSETIQIQDASSGTVLDTESVSNFSGGKYLVWNVSGHVTVSVTNAGSSALNTVCSGIFFDPSSTATPSLPPAPTGLTAVVGDTTTHLSWNASDGATGFNVKRATVNGGPYTTIKSISYPAGTTSYDDTGLTDGTTYYYVVSAVDASGEGPNSAQVTAVPLKAAAAFVTADTTTLGNWKGVYGADGYSVFEDSANYPGYVQVTRSSLTRDYTWSSSPTDPRALQRQLAPGRIAACWYHPTTFNIDLDLTDGQAHRVAFYCIDWEHDNRAETVQILDAATNAILDTQTLSNFTGGTYLVWNLSGHVTVKITSTNTNNCVCSGIFFDASSTTAPSAPPTPTGLTTLVGDSKVTLSWNPSNGATSYNVKRSTRSGGPYTTVGSPAAASYVDTGVTNNTGYYYVVSAVNAGGESANSIEMFIAPEQATALFQGTDTTTQGNWHGVYGQYGYNVFEESYIPEIAGVTPSANKRDFVWNPSPTDPRALQRGVVSGRIAACWYNPTSFSMDLNLMDGESQVELYFIDWEHNNRAETVQIIDDATGAVLDTETVSNFTGGKYLIWDLSGHVSVKITTTSGPNCVCSGIFFF